MNRFLSAALLVALLPSTAHAEDPGSFTDMAPYLQKCPGFKEDIAASSAVPKPDLTGMDQNAQIVATCKYFREKLPFDTAVGDDIKACAAGDYPILGSISAIYDGGYLHGFQLNQVRQLCHVN